MDSRQPVIIGVAQYTNRSRDLDQAREPMEMMELVARAADEDAGRPDLLRRLDSLQVVNILSWPYADPPGMLAERLGASPSHALYTTVGGDTPLRLLNKTAARIHRGESDLALIVGAEAMHSLMLARRLGVRLPWTERPARRAEESPAALLTERTDRAAASHIQIDGDPRHGYDETEALYGITLPVRVFPLFENALRAHRGHGVEEHQRYIARLSARLSQMVVHNPYAWFPQPRTEEEILSVGPQNRMVCFPYPKLMNSMLEVDQAAAFIVASAGTARELGVPEERWAYLWSGAYGTDARWFMREKPCYHRSLIAELTVQRALALAGLTPDDIDLFDIYSCFPAAVEIGMAALGIGLDDPRPLTLTGGLPYAGGPGNNYASHSLTAAVAWLRRQPEKRALLTAPGWYFAKHAVAVLSGRPPLRPFRPYDPQEDWPLLEAQESPPLLLEADGPATVETYTVVFDRQGEPAEGIVIGRLDGGQGPRFLANTPADRELLSAMCQEEFVGKAGRVRYDRSQGKNVFIL